MSNQYGSVPQPSDSQFNRGYGLQSGVTDFAQPDPTMSSPTSTQQRGFDDASQLGPSAAEGPGAMRSASSASTAVGGVSRNNTLRKRTSVRRTGSLRRSNSKRSLKAGSIKGFGDEDGLDPNYNSVFFTPVPTSGNPTEILANRFQAWRQLLKSLITYFREIQNSYDMRAKALHKVQNTLSNIVHPTVFMTNNGLGEAAHILDEYHKRSITEANKSKEIENDVIGALTGLRSDLSQKIKEIKSLSGDFKNSVEKEKDTTRKEIEKLTEALDHVDHHIGTSTGKNDPFVVRLGVDRAVEKQIDEENYLHRAYLNLESSGRELESIVVGEIQKAYNALAGILKREGDDAYNVVESLRTGPISLPKDQEWYQFVTQDSHFVDPSVPLRRVEDIEYPGKNHPAASEIRAGMLERKSKYLKSYTPGWYILSPTHLHEFKSAEKIYSQPPVMSLPLSDQKLGSHSELGSSSHKFMLKGKQSGSMHKGHNWVFRAESHDTMVAWFDDIRILTEKTGEERNAFVRRHARSVSAMSDRNTVSSDGLEEDEADQVPYSAAQANLTGQNLPQRQQRPQPGGRFPSNLAIRTGGPSIVTDGETDDEQDVAFTGGMISGSAQHDYGDNDPYRLDGVTAGTRTSSATTDLDDAPIPTPEVANRHSVDSQVSTQPVQTQTFSLPIESQQPVNQQQPVTQPETLQQHPLGVDVRDQADPLARHNSSYASWMTPALAAAGAGAGAGAAVIGADALRHQADGASPAHVIDPPVSDDGPVNNSAHVASPTSESNVSTAAATHEVEGARDTANPPPPGIVRHSTSFSISALHVPGEYPKRT